MKNVNIKKLQISDQQNPEYLNSCKHGKNLKQITLKFKSPIYQNRSKNLKSENYYSKKISDDILETNYTPKLQQNQRFFNKQQKQYLSSVEKDISLSKTCVKTKNLPSLQKQKTSNKQDFSITKKLDFIQNKKKVEIQNNNISNQKRQSTRLKQLNAKIQYENLQQKDCLSRIDISQINEQNIKQNESQILFQRNESSSGESKLIKIDISQLDKPQELYYINQCCVQQWIEGDIIGSGQFGTVYQAFNLQTQEMFAIKKICLLDDNDGNLKERLIKEQQINIKLKHNNILKYNNYEIIDNNFCIYMDYMSQGSILQILEKKGQLEENMIKNFAQQILEGLIYLHDNNIVHKDLKCANILINDKNQIKLSDFGCSVSLEKTLTSSLNSQMKELLQGSIPWMAPEIIQQSKQGRKSDIWSFGCTLIEICSGKSPWSEQNFENPMTAILKIGIQNELPQMPDNIDLDLKNIIELCLQRNYEDRPSAKQLLEHQYFNKNI